jgi:hypothetical protein
MNDKTIILGERRIVSLEVWLNDGSTFQPENCTWQLLAGARAEDEGACELEQAGSRWRLSCEIQPKQRLQYKLQYTFSMGTEIIKRSVTIKVM